MKGQYPSIKDIIQLMGAGTLVTASILTPGLGIAVAKIIGSKERDSFRKSQKEWSKFNIYALRRNIKRLQDQKIAEFIDKNGEHVLRLTEKGHSKYLKFKLENISLKANKWDGKWRIVLYDIEKIKKSQQESFRRMLKYINFLKIQRSVYLTPYQCEDHIEYLRQYFDLGNEVLLIRADKVESEEVYKKYFGIS